MRNNMWNNTSVHADQSQLRTQSMCNNTVVHPDQTHLHTRSMCNKFVQSSLPEGKGSDRLIVFAVDLHMYASGVNPVSYHPAGYYALKDNMISLPIAYCIQRGRWHDYV